ncbi:MAG: hypothetical protein ABIJ12_09000 [bacterium]
MVSLFWKSLALIFILTVSVFGQTNYTIEGFKFEFQGSGARAEGMGKAFLSVSDDNTAGSWNPAGLYELDRPILSLSYGSAMPRGNTQTFDGFYRNEFGNLNEHSGSFGGINGINFVAPLRIKGHPFVGSFSFTKNNDEYQAFQQSYTFLRVTAIPIFGNQIFYDSTNFLLGYESKLEGGMASVNFSLGTRIYQNFSAGVALNVYTGNTVLEVNQLAYSDSVLLYPSLQMVRGAENVQVIDSNKFSGFNFTLGTKYSGNKFNVALIVRTPFSLNVKTGKSIFVVSSINGQPIIEGTDTTYYDDILVKYDVPLIIGGGVSFKATEKLLFALDAEYKGFSSSKVKVRDSLFLDPGGDNTEFFTEVDPHWNSVLSFRVGGEYKFSSKIGILPVRAGFGYLPRVDPNYEVATPYSYNTSTSTENAFSVGTGIWWSQIHLDFAYTYSTYEKKMIGINQETVALQDLYLEKNKDHHVNFTFTGYF